MYEASFVAKNFRTLPLNAAETQTWIHFAVRCQYLDANTGKDLLQTYDRILGMLIGLTRNSKAWTIPNPSKN